MYRFAAVSAALLLFFPCSSANAQSGGAAPDLSDRVALEAFMDGVMTAQLEVHDVPGATLSIVKDGEVLLAKGYGWADAARSRPVDAEETLFRVASISKLILWTAVMQLVEQGKLDLNTDVNEYLTQFKIPEKFGQPVTLRHLMTHTAGFEYEEVGILTKKEADLRSLAGHLAAHMPARVRPPGRHASYSNWGAALAGLIVANVSGMDFGTYVERNILQPLDMKNSSFRQPLPKGMTREMSAGLVREKGLFEEKDFELLSGSAGPSGALSSTAADMANFMVAYLQEGRFGTQRILTAGTVEGMQAPLFRADDRLPGGLHGFGLLVINGRQLMAHSGATQWFFSLLFLVPEEETGLFMSFNAPGGSLATGAAASAFLDRYFPAPEPDAIDPPSDFSARAGDYTGAYRINRRSYMTFEKIQALFGDLTISATEEGRLVMPAQGGKHRQLVEVDRDLFRIADEDQFFAFERNAKGEVTHLLFPGAVAADKLDWWQAARTHQVVLGLGALIFLGVIAGSLWGLPKWFAMTGGEKLARFALFVAAGLYVAFLAGMAVVIVPLGNESLYGWPPVVSILLHLSLAGAVFTALAVAMAVPAWAGGYWSVFGRLRYTMVVLLLAAFTWSLWYWNAMGWWTL